MAIGSSRHIYLKHGVGGYSIRLSRVRRRESSVETTNSKERLARINIPVTGMTCASCVRRVERTLSKKEGVAEASVNFASEKASLSYDPKATSPSELVGVIRDAGYGANVGEKTFGVTGMTCASCVGRVERALEKVPG